VHELAGATPAARAALDRAIATEATGGEPARFALARAHAARLDRRHSEAEAGFTWVITTLGVPGDRWWIGLQLAEAHLGRAQARRDAGRRADAMRDATQAAAALDEIQARQQLAWIARRATLARALVIYLTSRPGSR
jgi:hypothetical protein